MRDAEYHRDAHETDQRGGRRRVLESMHSADCGYSFGVTKQGCSLATSRGDGAQSPRLRTRSPEAATWRGSSWSTRLRLDRWSCCGRTSRRDGRRRWKAQTRRRSPSFSGHTAKTTGHCDTDVAIATQTCALAAEDIEASGGGERRHHRSGQRVHHHGRRFQLAETAGHDPQPLGQRGHRGAGAA